MIDPSRWRATLTLHRLEEGLVALILAAMVLLAGTQILFRNLFDSGFAWIDPLLRLLVLWVGMLGAMIATRSDKHIRIDLLTRYVPEGWRHRIALLTSLFSAVISGLLCYHSARFVYFEWQDRSELFASIPSWLGEAILPIGFSVITLRFVITALQQLESKA